MTTTSEAEINALMRRYIDRFNAGDFTGAFECYRMPFTWLSGVHATTVTTRAEFVATLQATRDMLDADGFARTELLSTSIRPLDAHAVMISIVAVRIRDDGSEIGRLNGNYLAHNDGLEWRLVANETHSIEAPD